MSLSSNFPTIRPTLLLDFANTGRLDPRVTFTRATTATYFDQLGVLQTAQANEPRFDYNPSTLAPLGLLIEEARTNLLLQSQTFQTTWTPIRTTISADAAVAPDSTLTGDKFIATSVAGSHLISQTISVTAQAYTLTCFAKAGEYNFIQLNIPDPGAGGAGKVGSFNLSTGTLGVVQDAGVTRTITSVGNGWYRCSITYTVTGAGSSGVGFFVTNTDVRAESFTGNDVNGIFIWGAQLEAGAFATSYIPTTTTALTRNADVASMTGTNFSSWYNAAESTAIVDYLITATRTSDLTFVRFDDGGSNNRFQIGTGGSFTVYNSFAITSGAAQGNNIASVSPLGQRKVAFAIGTNSSVTAASGTVGTTDTSVTVPSGLNRLMIGRDDTSGYVNGWISRIAYYPTRLPNATLQALTA